jgi:hypothetical protein
MANRKIIGGVTMSEPWKGYRCHSCRKHTPNWECFDTAIYCKRCYKRVMARERYRWRNGLVTAGEVGYW